MGLLMYNQLIAFVVLICSVKAQDFFECDVQLTIDDSVAEGCLLVDEDNDMTVYACGSLESMLNSVASNEIDDGLNCTELQISPGEHIIQQNYTFTGKNMKITQKDGISSGSAEVIFDINQSILNNLSTLEPLYVWRFESSDLIEIRGLSFLRSQGIILAINVTHVTFQDNLFM